MANRTDLETKIADDLARSDLATQIAYAVDTAIKAYEEERFWFNEVYAVTATLSSSTVYLDLTALPVGFADIDRLRLQRSANDYIDLYRRDYDWIMSRQDAISYVQPAEYCLYGQKIQFDSYSDRQYVLVIDGLKLLADTVASNSYSSGSVAAWFNEARELIRHRARRELYMHVILDDNMAKSAKVAEDDAYETLKSKTNARTATGFVRPTQF